MVDAQAMTSVPERTVASAPSTLHGGPRLEPESWAKPPFMLKPAANLPGPRALSPVRPLATPTVGTRPERASQDHGRARRSSLPPDTKSR